MPAPKHRRSRIPIPRRQLAALTAATVFITGLATNHALADDPTTPHLESAAAAARGDESTTHQGESDAAASEPESEAAAQEPEETSAAADPGEGTPESARTPDPARGDDRTEPRPASDPAPVTVANGTRYRATGRVSAPPAVSARSWVAVDMATGNVLADHRRTAHLPQASTIKLLTALTAAETVPASPSHEVTYDEAHPDWCTCAGLEVGRTYTREALLAGMLLPSGNDAAEALAGSHPQGRDAFVAAMNRTAQELGATDTHAVTPSGLTAPGAYSSAQDLVTFLRAAEKSPVVAPILDLPAYSFGPRGGPVHDVYRGTDYANMYARTNPGTVGKSGYTSAAQNTLVVSTPIGGHRIGVATLGSPAGYSTSGARGLTTWAAANFDKLQPLGEPLPAPPTIG